MNITPSLRLFLQESDKTRGLEFFMPQEYVWSDLHFSLTYWSCANRHTN